MTKNKDFFSMCPYCGDIAWPVAIDSDGKALVLECYNCGYQGQPEKFLDCIFEYELDWD